jgi:hypothetical protein
VTEIRITISDLKSEGKETIKELTEFLKGKTEAEVDTATDAIIVKGEDKAVSKKYVKVLLKKFLHKNELKDYYRVIAGEENSLMVKEKKISEEEE